MTNPLTKKPIIISRLFTYIIVLTALGFNSAAQVTTNSGSGLAASYSSLANAIAALNAAAITNPVVMTLTGNEVAPAGGYSITAQGSAANTIIIQGIGSTITTATPQATGALNDAIFKIIGGDFITIQNFTMLENGANTVNTPAASNNMTEWGIALLYASTTNGSQNNIIQGNTISLSRTYANSFGIYSNVAHSPTAVTTITDITNNTTAPNSGNKVYGNNISNVNLPICFAGSITAANFDVGNDIGGTSPATGNIITNWGGAAPLSAYAVVSATSFGIYMNYEKGCNVSFNTLTSATISSTVTFRGIFIDYSVTAPTGTFANTINNNVITMSRSSASGTFEVIRSQGMTALSTATININNNSILNCSVSGAASSTNISGIVNASAPGMLSISNNIISGTTSTATTGGFTGISNTGSVGTSNNINSNQIGNGNGGAIVFSAATSGSVTGITNSGGASTCNLSIQNNDFRGIVYSVLSSSPNTYIINSATTFSQNISNNTFTNLNVNTTSSVTFISCNVAVSASGSQTIGTNSIVTAFAKGGAGGIVQLFFSNASSSSGATINQSNNNFSNITVSGATTIEGWRNTDGGSPSKIFNNNTFNNWTCGSSAVAAMTLNFGSCTVTNNTISNISGSGNVMGINTSGSSTATGNFSGNSISGLSSTGISSTVSGISMSATTLNIFKNKIYDLSGNQSGTMVNGINVITSATTVNIFNNLIGDFRASAATNVNAINGINCGITATYNVSFNTVFLSATSSSATTFGTSCISFSSSATAFNLRDNILTNLSTPSQNGMNVAINGVSACLRRSSGTSGTVPANYATISNNNAFWCNPSAGTNNHSSYVEGTSTITNAKNSVTDLKAFMVNRDQASVEENPTFTSTIGSNSQFLHINTSVATSLETGGMTIATITDDYDGDSRSAQPDIGADEFNGTPASPCSSTPIQGLPQRQMQIFAWGVQHLFH